MSTLMHEEVKINNPLVVDGEVKKDKYGRHETIESLSNARVQRTSKLVLNSDNEQIRATIEIDLPPESKIYDGDRKSTRLNSSHVSISYAVFCLKKKIEKNTGRHAS